MRTITLTTDFGTRDSYVSAMKGVLLSINPAATIVDVTHEIPPHDVAAGGFVLMGAAPYFGRGTIHVAVVDPGVGGERRPLALECGGHFFIGPDNGLLPLAASRIGKGGEDYLVVHLTESRYWRADVSRTFHGRDIFAPVAAHLSLGVPLTMFGPLIADPITLPFPAAVEGEGGLIGEIVYIDHFGNCITNIPDGRLTGGGLCVQLHATRLCGVRGAYADVARGESLALIGSSGMLEIAVREGSAAQQLQLRLGDRVHVGPAA